MDAWRSLTTDVIARPSKNGLVEISRTEAIMLQWQLISNWKHGSETWPFKWGIGGLAGIAATSGIMLGNASRKALNLKLEMKRVSMLPNAFIPSMFAGAAQCLLVSSKVLIGETKCLTCLETKSAAYQLGFGVGFPMLLAPFTAMGVATKFYSHEVPYMWEFKKLGQLWWKIVKKIQIKIGICSLVNVTAATLLTYQQIVAFNVIEKKLDSIEEEINQNV